MSSTDSERQLTQEYLQEQFESARSNSSLDQMLLDKQAFDEFMEFMSDVE